MSPAPAHMTGNQIAAANRRERERAAAARLAVEGAVSGGPFDVDVPAPTAVDDVPTLADLDLPPFDPIIVSPAYVTPDDAAAALADDLRTRLAAAAPTPPADRFAPTARPRIVDHTVIVPAVSVEHDPLATWVLIPVDQVATIGRTARAVGVTPRTGRWLPVWVGDDPAELDAVFAEFAADYTTARRSAR